MFLFIVLFMLCSSLYKRVLISPLPGLSVITIELTHSIVSCTSVIILQLFLHGFSVNARDFYEMCDLEVVIVIFLALLCHYLTSALGFHIHLCIL